MNPHTSKRFIIFLLTLPSNLWSILTFALNRYIYLIFSFLFKLELEPIKALRMNLRSSVLSYYVIGAMVLFGLTSCGDIEQNLTIKPDGSGTLETSFDIGEMMSMIKGFGDAGMEEEPISIDQEVDTIGAEAPKDPMQLLIDKVTDSEYDREFDTLMPLLSIMPDSVKQKETRKDLAERLSVRMKSPALSSDLTIGLVMKFDNQAQLKELVKYMETMDNSSSSVMASASPGGMQAENFLVFDADLKAGWIRFDSVDYSGMATEFGMSSDSLMSGEDMGMLEMMLGSTKIKSIIHVPGEVTSCTHKDAIITKDNKVMVEYGLMDAIKQGKIPGYTIHFNPGKS